MIDSDYEAAPNNGTPDFPWPPRENESVLDAAARTWQESLFHPTSFFRRMPREFDFGWVLGYYVVIGVIAAGLALFWRMLLGPSLLERYFLRNVQDAGNPIMDFLLSPLISVIAVFIAAGFIHVFLMLFRAGRHGFGTTLRVLCFTGGAQLFYVVPWVGPVIAGVWSIVLTVIGLREAHETTTGRVLAAFLIPFILLLILAVLIVFASLFVGASQLRA